MVNFEKQNNAVVLQSTVLSERLHTLFWKTYSCLFFAEFHKQLKMITDGRNNSFFFYSFQKNLSCGKYYGSCKIRVTQISKNAFRPQ